MIVPESPVKIMLSSDGGTTWKESVVCGSNEMGLFGDLRDDVRYSGGYIGFFKESGGYLVLTGAGFSTPETGFISYRYYEDSGPDIWWTSDEGDSWQKLPVTLPEQYPAETHRFTLQTPVFDGKEGVYPIAFWRRTNLGKAKKARSICTVTTMA